MIIRRSDSEFVNKGQLASPGHVRLNAAGRVVELFSCQWRICASGAANEAAVAKAFRLGTNDTCLHAHVCEGHVWDDGGHIDPSRTTHDALCSGIERPQKDHPPELPVGMHGEATMQVSNE